MANQQQLSQQAQVVLSLLKDVETTENRISTDSSDYMFLADRLIKGDLAIAQRAASNLSGEERSMLVAMADFREASITYRLLGNTLSGPNLVPYLFSRLEPKLLRIYPKIRELPIILA